MGIDEQNTDKEFKVDLFNRGRMPFSVVAYILEHEHEYCPQQFTLEMFPETITLAIERSINKNITKHYAVMDVILQRNGKFRIVFSKRMFPENDEEPK